jgi:hypothetical protein
MKKNVWKACQHDHLSQTPFIGKLQLDLTGRQRIMHGLIPFMFWIFGRGDFNSGKKTADTAQKTAIAIIFLP